MTIKNNKISLYLFISGAALFVSGLLIILAKRLEIHAFMIDLLLPILSLILIHRYLIRVKSVKILKFMIIPGIVFLVAGILIPYGIVFERQGAVSDMTGFWLSILSGIFIYPYCRIKYGESVICLITPLIMIHPLIINDMWKQDISDSMAKKGVVRIVARVVDVCSGGVAERRITYEFVVDGRSRIDSNSYSWRNSYGLKAGDTIIITYSVDNPGVIRFYEMFPNRKLIEKYKRGVYIDPKEYEKRRKKQ